MAQRKPHGYTDQQNNVDAGARWRAEVEGKSRYRDAEPEVLPEKVLKARQAAERRRMEDALQAAELERAERARQAAERERAEKVRQAAERERAEKARMAAERERAEKVRQAAELERAERVRQAAERERAEKVRQAAELERAERARQAAELERAERARQAAELERTERARQAAERKKTEKTWQAVNPEHDYQPTARIRKRTIEEGRRGPELIRQHRDSEAPEAKWRMLNENEQQELIRLLRQKQEQERFERMTSEEREELARKERRREMDEARRQRIAERRRLEEEQRRREEEELRRQELEEQKRLEEELRLQEEETLRRQIEEQKQIEEEVKRHRTEAARRRQLAEQRRLEEETRLRETGELSELKERRTAAVEAWMRQAIDDEVTKRKEQETEPDEEPLQKQVRKKPARQEVRRLRSGASEQDIPEQDSQEQMTEDPRRSSFSRDSVSAGRKQISEDPRRKPSERGRNAEKSEQPSRKNKVFSKAFKKGFFISWGIFIVLLIAGMVLLWTFLKNYESGLPEHYIEAVKEQVAGGDLTGLHLETADGQSLDDGSLFADKTSIGSYISSRNAETPLSYVKVNAETEADQTVYYLRSGEDLLLKVYLVKNSEDGKDNGWHEKKTSLAKGTFEVSVITAQIPTTSSLLISGTPVDRSFISESEAEIKLLSNLIAHGIIGKQPTVDTYTVKGIFADPVVEMQNEDGSKVKCTLTEDVYSAGFEADEDFVNEQRDRVIAMFEPYAKYFSGDAPRDVLSTFMLDGSPAYNSAVSADVSWMQEHDGIELSEQSAENFRLYSEECYSCEIRFKQDIYQNGEVVRTWDTHMTWIFVKDGDYYLADFMTSN